VTYTGDGTTSRTISGVGFAPDLIWGKSRGSVSDHNMFDSIRGAGNLRTNLTSAESDYSAYFSTLTSDGFTTGTTLANSINKLNDPFVAWNWKAGGGTAVSNTTGTITSSVSANPTAGFSIVSYNSGNITTSATVGHGLSKAPEMVIIKNRSGDGWVTYSKAVGNTKALFLNSTSAASTGVYFFNNTSPTDDVFSLGYWHTDNVNNIAYCFHSVDGYSKVGSYTGNGSSDGTFVHTGFKPAYVMIKRATANENWGLYDNKRNGNNPTGQRLLADTSGAETTYEKLDFVSNGIKVRGTSGNTNVNGTGDTYIYIAFAEHPFKYSTAK
jgi:hypothetical protein